MPLFFFLSGLFFSESKSEGVITTIMRNARSLLLYSTGFYLFYAIVCQVISRMGFVAFAEPLSINKILLDQFSLSGAYQFTAAYWFIPCLFLLKLYFSIIHSRLFSLAARADNNLSHLLFFGLYLLLACTAVWYSAKTESTGLSPTEIILLRLAFAAFFYYFGCIFSKYKLSRATQNVFMLAALYVAQQQLWAAVGNLDFWMQISKYQNTYTPVICSVIAIIFFYGLSSIAAANASVVSVMGYLGRHTLPIVLHHLFGFFLLNMMLCALGVINIEDVNSPYYQYDTVHTWPLYITAGILYSLAFDRYVFTPIKEWLKLRGSLWMSAKRSS